MSGLINVCRPQFPFPGYSSRHRFDSNILYIPGGMVRQQRPICQSPEVNPPRLFLLPSPYPGIGRFGIQVILMIGCQGCRMTFHRRTGFYPISVTYDIIFFGDKPIPLPEGTNRSILHNGIGHISQRKYTPGNIHHLNTRTSDQHLSGIKIAGSQLLFSARRIHKIPFQFDIRPCYPCTRRCPINKYTDIPVIRRPRSHRIGKTIVCNMTGILEIHRMPGRRLLVNFAIFQHQINSIVIIDIPPGIFPFQGQIHTDNIPTRHRRGFHTTDDPDIITQTI